MGRLPEGVEYTFIKMIVSRAPSPLTTLLWVQKRINEPVLRQNLGRRASR